MSDIKYYKNNVGLKSANQKIAFTPEQVEEYMKCAQDPIHFIENYVKIISLDDGAILFKMHPYQKRMIKALQDNTRLVGKWGRQMGKSTTLAAYTVWFVLFNEFKTVAILANKMDISKEIFGRVQFAIENLPIWLQQGIVEWNKTSFELENGSVCFAAATSPSAIRGKSCVTGDTLVHLLAEDGLTYCKTIDQCLNDTIKYTHIKTIDNQYKSFDGFIHQGKKECLHIITDTTEITCTHNHRLMMYDGVFTEAKDLSIDDILYPNEIIIDILKDDEYNVYDALNVNDVSCYYTNGLISHNCNMILLDEFAHLKPNLAEEFIKSVFPTISSSMNSKMAIISTPNGLNHFYKIWNDSENGRNDFVRVEGHWTENPYRSQKWADQQLKELGQVGFDQEVNCIGGEAIITIKDTETNEIKQISFEELYNLL